MDPDPKTRSIDLGKKKSMTKPNAQFSSSSYLHRFNRTKIDCTQAIRMRFGMARISPAPHSSMSLSTNKANLNTSNDKRKFIALLGRTKRTRCSKNDFETITLNIKI